VTGAIGAAAGEASVIRLLDRHPEVTGLLCYNDALALGALRGIRTSGRRVPGDVSVVGFDDIDLAAYAEPPLTTVRQDIRGLGRWAVDRLLEDLRDPVVPRADRSDTLRWPVRLIVRDSTAGPPDHG
jgi:DNA-binding LacI/PurR family transcriptional regulator